MQFSFVSHLLSHLDRKKKNSKFDLPDVRVAQRTSDRSACDLPPHPGGDDKCLYSQFFSKSRAKFYKSRSQEKTLLRRPEFFLLRSPPDRARSVLTYRSMCPVAGQYRPAVGVFSTSGFHRFFATKPVSSETSKAERWSNLATIVLLGTRGP